MGFMDVGDIPRDWRQRRTAVQVDFPDDKGNSKFSDGIRFIDVEAVETREAMRPDFEELLAFYKYPDLDIPVVRGRDRRMTRYISQWAFEQVDEAGNPLYAGIRYLSRLSNDWECWAVFDDVEPRELNRKPILAEDPAFKRIAKLYGLTPH